MTATVNTVLGPITAGELGKTLVHEHFVFGYPGFEGDSTLGGFDRDAALQAGIETAKKLQNYGVKTVVDATANECGRNPELLKEISERTGLQIICSTGYYYEGESAPAYFKFRAGMGDGETEIYEMYIHEITQGIGKTGVKAGAIKLASSKDVITQYETMFFRAAARAHKETGVSIITHTQEGTMGEEQAELLISLGVDPSRVLIGHMCGNTKLEDHARVLKLGANVGFDRFGLEGIVGAPFDSKRVEVLANLIDLGFEKQLFISQDSVNVWLGRPLVLPPAVQQLLAQWHPTHIFEDIIPMLKDAGITDEQLETLLIDNPGRLFGA
ncbi:putative metal-dependent hydrolase with the TIM-barrel fold [Desulfosporosinus orientis DSM 765]|uniref:Putative metal-dependent hydrolase with the TIM-barrel fold n=1 Tax=Desulfosporosinus orientis (strain ATCC 19365 / DSM 765 / NCIMB 8382 / VKM B-1628 / Singapore I) TaxID=768706 RepID=G7W946_DESOD|nr:phosphotriesterase-related protein [Desulfosporosinus orientis]AET68687.1 putative metal-dependent hydrolase with the TIM-barrel fold [Desulfosporosinus orientis DSM 765]